MDDGFNGPCAACGALFGLRPPTPLCAACGAPAPLTVVWMQEAGVPPSGPRLWVLDAGEGMRVFIEVGEATTHEGIDGAVPAALSLREAVREPEPPPAQGTKAATLDELLRQHAARDGRVNSYADLARQVNEQIDWHLREWVESQRRADRAQDDLGRPMTALERYDAEGAAGSGYVFAEAWLTFFGWSSAAIDELVQEALERARPDRSLFRKDYPISGDDVYQRLRRWRASRRRRGGVP